MTETAQRGPAEPPGSIVTALRSEQQTPLDLARLVAEHNRQSKAHEKLYARAKQAADLAARTAVTARQADGAQDDADAAYEAIQAEQPDRHSPRPRQCAIAGGALLLDGVPCYFAAEALGAGLRETIAWSVLFLAVLGIGEIALDHFSEDHRAVWRWIAAALAAFIGLLGVLRYSFLVTVGADGLVAAIVGTALFTAATTGFLLIGYRALRLAEASQACRARRRLRALERAAQAAHRKLDGMLTRRDRLAGAYLARIRLQMIQTCSSSEISQMEQILWAHLVGQVLP